MNAPPPPTAAERSAEQRPGQRVEVLVVHSQTLLRDGLTLLLEGDPTLSVVGAVCRVDEATALCLAPDVVLFSYNGENSVGPDAQRLQAAFPTTKLLVLDDSPNDGRVLLALRTDVRGYLTTQQAGVEIVTAIRKTAVGERVFTPEIAARLSFTQEGIRLQRPMGEVPLASLTPREREVMTYLSLGYTVKQTASTLGLRPSTVDNHKTRLMKKLKVHKTVELTRLAFRYGLVASDGAAPEREVDHQAPSSDSPSEEDGSSPESEHSR